ncbi:NAD-dependent epimerase/dehydratase family protein [Gelidibacter salicanalis]|uniref:NAD-dependent epimerase/dehydratase family protein n=1 Tax=Gelidibacter salicanalis TaxID=291193 RepID=A0A934KSU0_9FLAO|nr:NAD-dependent epimerase/dehydratase family protein [Gelidibacter salicanalis]MBJ7880092.1 NAD-dependent epimerase/dehydratase family protein [Gelidibacter salicanalis]
MILVTGGTGLVGSHLLFKLLQTNAKVKAIYRREQKLDLVKKVFSYYTEDVESLYKRIEWLEADITDVPSLAEAFKQVNYVYHCAALVSFEPDKYRQLRKINIEGTANVVNLCISNQIKKLCYVSSIATIGHHQNPGQVITEETFWNQDDDNSTYAITKYGAETEVWRGTQEGVDAVILNPGIIIGPGFWNSGGSSSLIKKIYKGMAYFTHGVTGYVDVDDVVNAMLLLMLSDIKNERFIVISENLSFKEFQHQTALALNVEPPAKEATAFILALGWRLDWLYQLLTGKRRRLSKQMTKSAKSITTYDASKLKNALDFQFKPMAISIKDTAKLFLNDLKK